MSKKVNKKRPWTVKKYLLVFRREEDFEEVLPVRGTGRQFLLVGVGVLSALVLGIALTSISIYNFWQAHYTDEALLRRRALVLAQKTDELQVALHQQTQYLRSLHAIFRADSSYLVAPSHYEEDIGGVDTSLSSFLTRNKGTSYAPAVQSEASPTSLFSLDTLEQATNLSHYLHLVPPIRGFVSDHFSRADAHYGVDLLAPKGATVHATAQGTVIFSSWTQDGGYVIALQHARGLVSFYKHNTTLLKTVGDKVLAGDPLAIIGNTGALSTGPHLHFEIWHNSQPVDPESFITF